MTPGCRFILTERHESIWSSHLSARKQKDVFPKMLNYTFKHHFFSPVAAFCPDKCMMADVNVGFLVRSRQMCVFSVVIMCTVTVDVSSLPTPLVSSSHFRLKTCTRNRTNVRCNHDMQCWNLQLKSFRILHLLMCCHLTFFTSRTNNLTCKTWHIIPPCKLYMAIWILFSLWSSLHQDLRAVWL